MSTTGMLQPSQHSKLGDFSDDVLWTTLKAESMKKATSGAL